MPLGNRVWLGTRLPLESRLVSAQQSSMFTNWYPASLSPAETNLSAMPRIIVSLKTEPHLVVFQLLKPIGGGGGRPMFLLRVAGVKASHSCTKRLLPASQDPYVLATVSMTGLPTPF